MDLARRHLRFGWWALLVFTTLGFVLEGLHGFKVGAYLDTSNETRRLMWTLAHAHGTLLAIVNVMFGLTVRIMSEGKPRGRRLISSFLIAATIVLPGGFFMGGIGFYGGDPGLAALVLIPLGATLLLIAIFSIARMSI